MKKRYAKKVCETCSLKFKHLYRTKGKLLCYQCKRKALTPMVQIARQVSMQEALNREYLVKVCGKDNPQGTVYLPRCLIGKKIKIIVVEDMEEPYAHM